MMIIAECCVPYIIILINCALFKVLRKVLFPITPQRFRIFVSEFISTLELCATIAETGVIWAKHGDIGCSAAILLCCLWWAQVFEDAETAPFSIFEDVLLLGESIDFDKILRFSGQTLAAVATAFYTHSFWCFHLTEEHVALHSLKCEAALQVSVIYGMAVEFTISFISRFVALETTRLSDQISAWVNSITTTILCYVALSTTGGFFNPILASALTLNCEGNNFFEHFMVYWIAALIGGFLARYLHILLLKLFKKKSE